MRIARLRKSLVAAAIVALSSLLPPLATSAESAAATPANAITTEAQLRSAWGDPSRTDLDLGTDIVLRDCDAGDPIRESGYPMIVDGHGYAIRQTCFEQRLLRQDGTGYVLLRNLTLSRGGSDGPGAAVTTRGEITLEHCVVKKNLAEEPGGAVFSMRRATIVDSVMTGNLANDDGGAVYARRGGVRVYDSNLSNNLVDGSGGAIGSTGDIVVVGSVISGNTTDGDGGAIYADEDGDVTIVDSNIDGSNADGPGGAIFTLDGDVAIFGSSLIGNRADDRGGAISGEADVLLVNSTVARNMAVAHVGGGAWSRGDMTLVNSTVTDNYAEGEGGGVLSAGQLGIYSSTVSGNTATAGANVGAGDGMTSFGSIIGPARSRGDAFPTLRNCLAIASRRSSFNWVTDSSCGLDGTTNFVAQGDPMLADLEAGPNGRTLVPNLGSPVLDRIPVAACTEPVETSQALDFLLSQHVAWRNAASSDGAGTTRPQGLGCDIGAVELQSDP